MKEYISIKNLKFSYTKENFISELNIDIPKSCSVGLIGPSGSGKTTIIKLILGLLSPQKGSIKINNQNYSHNDLGYMPQQYALYEELSVNENLEIFSNLNNISKKSEVRKRSHELLNLIELSDKAKELVQNLSGGMKQRLSMAIAMINNPQILLLDEPTVGIDPVLRESFWNHFKKLNKNEITILITSHVMDDAMKCDKVIFFIEGKIVAYDTPVNLVKYTKTNNLGEAFVHIVNKGYKK
ncbi:MAG: hypothetical protein CL723_04110 [Chloroflexi bacterium]|jgi:ABC-2 type transport system ATP-binding protein|nr:hypothetical protein [Chloroflexota bacterium]|tara:strand:- start:146 stop:865 length:720 start_codon:yes stop_codon:yes gene_type:complete